MTTNRNGSPAPQRIFKSGQELPLLVTTPRFLIINKPPGLAVHPGPSTQDSVESRLITHTRGGPWLAHRLDTDTAGCLLIARRKTALIDAQTAFQKRKVTKRYWAILSGMLPQTSGEITLPLLRQSTPKGWKMIPHPKGDPAHSKWRVIHTQNNLSWVELTLLTGRTHQARAHCAALGTPILGDPVYGDRHSTGLHLLARQLEISLDTETLTALAPPAPNMLPAFVKLGFQS
ncbi:RluA family pseudouridine synthase [Swingsia samuiensis]|nr:RNA pseudouridine synthase [Swingsia samuiensis]